MNIFGWIMLSVLAVFGIFILILFVIPFIVTECKTMQEKIKRAIADKQYDSIYIAIGGIGGNFGIPGGALCGVFCSCNQLHDDWRQHWGGVGGDGDVLAGGVAGA